MERRLAAILAADVAGFSTLMERDEEGTFARIGSLRRDVIEPRLSEYQGRLIKTTGDGFLAEFASPISALRCAITIQDYLSNAPDALRLRIGINLGDVIVEQGGDVYGEGVNIAARLEGIADAGGILISGKIYGEVDGKVETTFEDRGPQLLKNISRPVHVYAVRFQGVDVGREAVDGLPHVPALPDRPSIAVLPFNNMSSDPEQEYFADGITEDVITELSRFKGLMVIARNSTFTYKNQAVDVKKVGIQLGVKYVLEGSVRRVGPRVRITAQLIEAHTGGHVWAERYDRELIDIFELQDEITKSVVATLQTEMILREGSLAERTSIPTIQTWTMSKKAWKLLYSLTRESLSEARCIARAMIESDPISPEGYRLFSLVTLHLVFMGFAEQRAQEVDEARQSIHAALRMDENNEHTHWALAILYGFIDGKLAEAEAAAKRSIEINPNFSLGYGTYGSVLAYAGRAEESIVKTQYAMRLNPRDPSIFFRYSALSIAHFLLSDFEQSRKWAQLAVERKPDWWVTRAVLTASLMLLGHTDAAVQSGTELVRIMPKVSLRSLPIEPVRPAAAKRIFYEALAQAGIPD
jgi:adenylate cyclase